jgi:hypothetical protein
VRRSARKTRKAIPFLRERRADRAPRGLASHPRDQTSARLPCSPSQVVDGRREGDEVERAYGCPKSNEAGMVGGGDPITIAISL